jgi:microcin C transport system substrate-binding protein
VNAKDLESLTAAGRALDRILLWEHMAIPHWHANNFRIAYWDKFGQPAVTPKYHIGIWTWWVR